MQTRKTIVSGQFYPAQHDACIDEINEFIEQIPVYESLPDTIDAGIVPHAGWMFSGALAAMVFSAIKQQHDKVNTFVLLGAAHSYFGRTPAIYNCGIWTTPLGDAVIDEDMARQVLTEGTAESDTHAHAQEHSLEVIVPFIQYLFPGAKILPIIVPPADEAVTLGVNIGKIIAAAEKKIICIGSTDLTHYGPRYNFTPMGTGTKGLKWATEINDQKFIDLALALKAEEILVDAAENSNACGSGAAAATVAAAKELGKTKGTLLAHTTSNDIMTKKMSTPSPDAVGYAAIVF